MIRPPEVGVCGTYHVYHVDKALGIIPRNAFNHLDLVTIREDGLYERDALVCGNGMADQPFPGRRVASGVAAHEDS